jgi:hypothetical protein
VITVTTANTGVIDPTGRAIVVTTSGIIIPP